MGGNIAGIYGAQIFRQDDRPLYIRGFSINIAILVVGLALAAIRFTDDFIRRRRNKSQIVPETLSDHASTEQASTDEKAAQPSDVQPAPIPIADHVKPVVSDAVAR
jgi:hypothetical protein